MLRRLFSLAMLAGLAFLAMAACAADAQPTPTPFRRSSPPPPPRAPVPTASAASPTPATPEPPGIPVSVNLKDPGGSGGTYQFDPSELTFSVADRITFTFTAETEFHTFTVDDLGIDVPMDSGTTDTLTFIFDKPGTYDLICIPHESQGMVGTITVQ